MRGFVFIVTVVSLVGLVHSSRHLNDIADSKVQSEKPAGAARGAPDLTIIKDIIGQEICITTAAEYAIAFAARSPRCVSTDLMGRVSQSRPGGSVSDATLYVAGKPNYFWTASGGLERYLRIGYPQRVGTYTETRNQTFTSGDFEGLEDMSTGLALLEALGYSGVYSDISVAYILNVFSRAAVKKLVRSQKPPAFPFNANVESLIPTWTHVRNMMQYVFKGIKLKISDAVVDMLADNSFAELSGCPTECTYAPLAFPSAQATTPIITAPRTSFDTCPEVANTTVSAPSDLESSSAFCTGMQGRTWADKYNAMTLQFAAGCNPAAALTGALFLKQQLDATDDVIEQALWFRAFLIQSCGGGFYSLFSGNGFTFAGLGGLLSSQGVEYITSPFNQTIIAPRFKAAIPFCINGLNGGMPGADGRCPIP